MYPAIALSQSLAELKPGQHAALTKINCGKGVTCRLTSLGFTPGVDIEMIQNYRHGPLVVMVRGTRVALGRQEAQKITIRRNAE